MKNPIYLSFVAAALFFGLGLSSSLAQQGPSANGAAQAVNPDNDDEGDGRLFRATPALPVGTVARYTVTYFKSNTSNSALRTAAIVSVTNQSTASCTVGVDWRTGGTATACSQSLLLTPGAQLDFCTRAIPGPITSCNATCAPNLTFNEGNAVVGSSTTTGCEKIAVSSRTVYTGSTADAPVSAITDAKIVKVGFGNNGD
jgi:hypothetical protein